MTSKTERRGHERTDCDIEARIELSDRLAIACPIKDLTQAGFKLQIAEAIYLPDEFDILLLMLPGADQRCRAKLVWRSADEVGGEFLTPKAQ